MARTEQHRRHGHDADTAIHTTLTAHIAVRLGAMLVPKVSHDWDFDAAVSLKLPPTADTDDRPHLAGFCLSPPAA